MPSAAIRRSRSPRLPTAVEAFYARALRRAAQAFRRAIEHALLPKLSRFAKAEDEQKLDADPPDDFDRDGAVDDVIGSVRSALSKAFDEKDVARAAGVAGDRLIKHSRSEFKRLGIDLVKDEPKFGPLISKWRKDNVSRIKSVHAQQLAKVEKILREGANRRSESLAKDIAERCDVTESKAELIARDQVLTLNAQITKERHTAAGVEKYVWTTSNDERVREAHEEIDGETFAWDDPPTMSDTGERAHPGEPVNCRCVPYPVLPELEEEGLE